MLYEITQQEQNNLILKFIRGNIDIFFCNLRLRKSFVETASKEAETEINRDKKTIKIKNFVRQRNLSWMYQMNA